MVNSEDVLKPIDSYQLFEEANKLMYPRCSGLALDDFVERKSDELSSIASEHERMVFVLEYIKSVGEELYGDHNFRRNIIRQIRAKYN